MLLLQGLCLGTDGGTPTFSVSYSSNAGWELGPGEGMVRQREGVYTKDKVRASGMSAFNNRSEGKNPEEGA